jgi:hypothetical protein
MRSATMTTKSKCVIAGACAVRRECLAAISWHQWLVTNVFATNAFAANVSPPHW